jgi:hypothetical protein
MKAEQSGWRTRRSVLCGGLGRILVSHDRRTMRAHFARFLEKTSNPELLIVSQDLAIGRAIEDLIPIWAASEDAEWRDQVGFLPL